MTPPGASPENRPRHLVAPSAAEEGGRRGEDTLVLNMGPQHPATHGVLRLVLELDGETIVDIRPVIGYLHRGSEKIAETMTFNQFVPYTDRLDYLAPLSSNVAYALAVEKLYGIEVPPRARCLRVICCELSRIGSHLLGLGAYAMDVGAMTVFLYCFRERETTYDLVERLTGGRLTTSFTRIGGLGRDATPEFLDALRAFTREMPARIEEYERLLTHNRIFRMRTEGVGVLSAEDAIAWGITGPMLRSSGVDFDLRKAMPYSGYEEYDFDVPTAEHGDCYDRYLVRIEELRQSVRILEQALGRLPGGPVNADDDKVVLPRRERVLTSMEELIHDFILTTEGAPAPEGEVYFGAENPKGELGFYVVGAGEGRPYRLHIRGPSFVNLQVLPLLLRGHLVSDITAVLGSLDFVMGECDR